MVLQGVMIGCGHVAGFQLKAWKAVRGANIVAVADLDEQRAQERAEEFGIQYHFTDYQQMITVMKPDFIDIATPPSTHIEMVRFGAQHSLPILCQKPAAPTMRDLEEMIAITEDAGVPFMINENARFQPASREIARICDGGIGRIFYANLSTRKRLSLPAPRFQQPFFATMPQLIVYELGVHLFDTLRYWFGNFDSIFAQTAQVSPHIAGEDFALVQISAPGLIAALDLSWASFPSRTYEQTAVWAEARIEGTEGTVELRRDGLLRVFNEEGEKMQQFPMDSVEKGYINAQQHFIDTLVAGGEFETSGRETLKTMELVFGAYHAAQSNHIYRVGEDLGKLQ